MTDADRCSAFHEAGYAVAAYRLLPRLILVPITIHPDVNRHSVGCDFFKGVYWGCNPDVYHFDVLDTVRRTVIGYLT